MAQRFTAEQVLNAIKY